MRIPIHEAEEAVRLLSNYATHLGHAAQTEKAGECRRLARTIRRKIDSGASLDAAMNPPVAPIARSGKPRLSMEKQQDGVTRAEVRAGIGDVAWMLKLRGITAKYGSPLEIFPAYDEPKRIMGFLELVPGIKIGGYCKRQSGQIDQISSDTEPPEFAHELVGHRLVVDANHHIERGRPLNEWMPDLPTEWDLELDTTTAHRAAADEILGKARGLVVGVHPVSGGTSFWDLGGWTSTLRGIYEASRCAFVIFGAAWDVAPGRQGVRSLAALLVEALRAERIPVRECFGQPFGVAHEVALACNLFLGVESGLAITSAMAGVKTVWWLPKKHVPGSGGDHSLLTGWIHPDWVRDGRVETRRVENADSGLAGILASGPFSRMMEKRK